MSDLAKEHNNLILDGTKINWHLDRVEAWQRGERIAPITIDMSLTRLVIILVDFVMLCFRKTIEK